MWPRSLRDQLDRKSAIILQLVAQRLATADMKLLRARYLRAREALTDCAAVLDILAEPHRSPSYPGTAVRRCDAARARQAIV